MPQEKAELKGTGVANERKAPSSTSDQRVIRRFADLGDWLNRRSVIDALEDGDAPGSNTRR